MEIEQYITNQAQNYTIWLSKILNIKDQIQADKISIKEIVEELWVTKIQNKMNP